MTSRQRGATALVALLLAGRGLDHCDLPFEAPPRQESAAARSDSVLERQPAAAVTVAAPGDVTPGPVPPPRRFSSEPAAHEVIAINQASAKELEELPGVGPVLAQRIIAHREAFGPLRSLDDLRRVQGIGARTAARLAAYVRFE